MDRYPPPPACLEDDFISSYCDRDDTGDFQGRDNIHSQYHVVPRPSRQNISVATPSKSRNGYKRPIGGSGVMEVGQQQNPTPRVPSFPIRTLNDTLVPRESKTTQHTSFAAEHELVRRDGGAEWLRNVDGRNSGTPTWLETAPRVTVDVQESLALLTMDDSKKELGVQTDRGHSSRQMTQAGLRRTEVDTLQTFKDSQSSNPRNDSIPPKPTTDLQLLASPLGAKPAVGSPSYFCPSPGGSYLPASSSFSIPATIPSEPSTPSVVQKAYQDARHFAGGLISHPSESSKHYTILRHSHGLVFYQGASTTLAISIFADAPLPSDRTIWLQNKGWSGKTGMRVKAFFGGNGDWLDVTPSTAVTAEQLKPTDERAWQRDIARFQKKSKYYKKKNHALRQTAVVRIPSEAIDGYFQFVMCTGEKKKVLCNSPSFRVLSTSASPHAIKGASLSTLPLELGALAASTYAKFYASKVSGPASVIMKSKAEKHVPKLVVKGATMAYEMRPSYVDCLPSHDDNATVMTDPRDNMEEGPQAPYPVRFVSTCDISSSERQLLAEIPSFGLIGPFDRITANLHGYYFGWVRFTKKLGKGKKVASLETEATETEGAWQQAVISALIIDDARVSITKLGKKAFTVRLDCDFEELPDDRSTLEIIVMGFIRHDDALQRAALTQGLEAGDESAFQAAVMAEVGDVQMAQTMLDHPAWGSSVYQDRQDSLGRLDRITTGFSNTKAAAQRHLERIPLHKTGIRGLANMKEKSVIMNGYYVQR